MPTVPRGLPRAARMRNAPVVVATLAPEHVDDLVYVLDVRLDTLRQLYRGAPAPERRGLQAEHRRLRRLEQVLLAALERRQAA